MSENINDLLKERASLYGPTGCKDTTAALDVLCKGRPELYTRLIKCGFFYSWFLILGKLVRAIYSPENPDHWRDICGYAKLVLNDLENSPKS